MNNSSSLTYKLTSSRHFVGILALFLVLAVWFTALSSTAIMQANYDCGTYSSGDYNDNCAEEGPGGSGTTNGQNSGGSSHLSNTGQSAKYYGLIGLICIVASLGIIASLRKRSTKK